MNVLQPSFNPKISYKYSVTQRIISFHYCTRLFITILISYYDVKQVIISFSLLGVLMTFSLYILYLPSNFAFGQSNNSDSGHAVENYNQFIMNLTKIDKWIPILGNPEANITVVEFGDYQCEHCKNFNIFQKDLLINNYTDTGDAKFIFRDFPVNDRNGQNLSSLAAEASYCAAEQDKYWQYHDSLFRSDYKNIDRSILIAHAKDVKISDVNQFENCLDSKKYNSKVDENKLLANQLNLYGTPTFVIYSSSFPEHLKIVVGIQNHTQLEGKNLISGFTK